MFTAVIWASLLAAISANYAVYNINIYGTAACGARVNVQRTDIRAVVDTTGASTLKFYGLNNAQTLAAAIADDANIPLVATLTNNSKSVTVKSYLKGKATATQTILGNAKAYNSADGKAAFMTRFQRNTWKSSAGTILQMYQYIDDTTLVYSYELSPGDVQMVPMYLGIDGAFTGTPVFYQSILCVDGTTWTTAINGSTSTSASTTTNITPTTASI
ncbi:unnamed protein product, partial [Mesorhabditis spiculigera]